MPRHRACWTLAVCMLAALIGGGACVKAEKDAGRFSALPVDLPILKEHRGAQLYLLRRQDESIIVFWGMSPLGGGQRDQIRCFIQDRTDRTVRGETRPFLDPCRGAWWSRDGRFLGYTDEPPDTPSSGPPLIRIPAEVRQDRIHVDEVHLTCLQNRQPVC